MLLLSAAILAEAPAEAAFTQTYLRLARASAKLMTESDVLLVPVLAVFSEAMQSLNSTVATQSQQLFVDLLDWV